MDRKRLEEIQKSVSAAKESGDLIDQLAREGDALLLDRVITALESLSVAPVESEEAE